MLMFSYDTHCRMLPFAIVSNFHKIGYSYAIVYLASDGLHQEWCAVAVKRLCFG